MSLMLINPRKRGGTKRRKARTAAQKAATARLVAHNRRKHRPAKRRTARRSNPIGLARVSHGVRRHRRARRRNPISVRGIGSNVVGLLKTGLVGAVGAVGVNAVTNFLPAQAKTGNMLYVTRAVLAILVGTVGSKVLGKHAHTAAEGAMIVNMHDAINHLAGTMLPGSGLHGMSEYLSAVDTPVQFLPHADTTHFDAGMGAINGVGEYMRA